MALGAGEGSLREGRKGGGGGLGEGNKGGGGGLGEGNKGGGGGLSEGNTGGLAGAAAEKGGLEGGKGCSDGRLALVLPELHGILIPGPGAASLAGGVAARAPIKIDFSCKGSSRAFPAKVTPGFSKNSGGKTVAGGLGTRVGVLNGLRILPLGFQKSSQEEVTSKIKALGGQISTLGEYDTCTHICLGNEMNKELIGESWINLLYDGDDVSISPEAAERNKVVSSVDSRPRRTTVELNSDKKVRRQLFQCIDEDKIRRLHHELFQCKNDESVLITLAAFARKMRRSLVIYEECPGTNRDDLHTSTLLELKLICKEIYLLLKALKKAGYSLAGNFTANNFVITERATGKSVVFGDLQNDSLQLTSPTGEKSDEKAFKRMIIGLFPKNVLPPHDLVTWLALVGHKDQEWLLLNNWTLLEEQDARERFLFLCGKLQELFERDRDDKVYWRIVRIMNERGYYNWQEKLEAAKGNNFLKNTLNRVHPHTKLHQDYGKHAGGLLLLLRNCRHHYAKAEVQKFLLIIADNFPNLLIDFQEVMSLEGFRA